MLTIITNILAVGEQFTCTECGVDLNELANLIDVYHFMSSQNAESSRSELRGG